MSPDSWRRVKEIAGAALEMEDPERRAAFVRERCAGDPELLQAVEDVLEGDRRAGSEIEGAIAATAAKLAGSSYAEVDSFEPGETVSHYRILSKLGQGGMGVVYKAEDLRLDRYVALKFMAPHIALKDALRRRFLREAKTAASLNHPNICTVHEIGETEGVPFIVMSYLEGADLAQRIRSGPLAVDELLDIAFQIGSALTVAHERGFVHRDIKPANIMLTPGGQAVLMDFGLAQVAADATRITGEGVMVGTSSYMSPEQVTGDELDNRTDVWALGVVLYEMATGKPPFRGHYDQAILYSILNESPAPLETVRRDTPPGLEKVVARCLAKGVKARYQSVADLLADLNALRGGTPLPAAPNRPSSGSRTTRPSIAVLPFENRGRDEEDEYLSDGITEALTIALGKVEKLRVTPRSLAFQFKGERPSPQDVGRKLNVEHLLEGTVRRSGNRVWIYAELTAVDEGFQIWSERYDRVMDDIFAIQDEISRAIVENLKITLAARDKELLAKRYTENLEAYNQCLRGRYYWFKRTGEAIQKAMELYQEALAADPEYALAHSGLADCYTALAFYGVMPAREATPRCEAAALRALQLEPDLAAAHTSIGGAESLKWNWTAAESAFQRATELDPSYPVAHLWFSLNALLPMGRLDEALVQSRRAAELDPTTPMVGVCPSLIRIFQRDYEAAIAELEEAYALEPNLPWTPFLLGLAYLNTGHREQAIAALRRADLPPWRDGHLGHACARAGDEDGARKLIGELRAGSRPTHLVPYHLAMIHLGLGETDEAFEYLNEACDLRSPQLFWIKSLPLAEMDRIRPDARFQDILRRMNLA